MKMKMMLANLNSSSFKKCAFCKHWYDPANTHIQPKSPRIGLWEYDYNAQSTCLLKRITKCSWHYCPQFERKIQ